MWKLLLKHLNKSVVNFSCNWWFLPKSNYNKCCIKFFANGDQGWQYGTVRYVGTVRYASTFAKKYGTLVRYAFLAMVRVRYVGTLFEFAY